jgi:glycerol-3-phosphate acyltransferase PlsY
MEMEIHLCGIGLLCATMPYIAFFRSDSQAYFFKRHHGGLIVYRHQSNLSRLLQGTENRWKTDSTQKAENSKH